MKTWLVNILAGRLGASWRTGIVGVGMIVMALGQAAIAICDDNPETKFSWEVTSLAVGAGVTAMLARDNRVSSTMVEAAKPGTIVQPLNGIGATEIVNRPPTVTKP